MRVELTLGIGLWSDGLIKSQRYAANRAMRAEKRRKVGRLSVNLKQWIAIFSSIILLGTVVLLSYVVLDQRRFAAERAWNDAANLSGAFEEQIRRVVESVRAAMELLKPRLAAEGAAFNLAGWTDYVPGFANSTVQVSFAGNDGRLLSTSLANYSPVDLSDREHIRTHIRNESKGLFIGRPVVGRVSAQKTIQFSDRVEDARGRLVGVLVFSLSPEFLTTLHRNVNLGESGTMILAGQDGVIRAAFSGRQATDAPYIGDSIANMKAVADAATADAGAYEGINPLTREPAFFHWRKVSGYPLIVIAGQSRREVFAAANRSATMLGGLAAIVLALTITMTHILNREISRGARRDAALVDESRKLVRANDDLKRQHRQVLRTSSELKAERARLQAVNAELRTAKEQADQASQAKTSLLMNMSHEFRTPMHAILNYTNLGLKKLDSPDKDRLHKYLTNIQVSGNRLLSMLNALLDLAKLESGKFELSMSRGDFLQIAQQAGAELSSLCKAKELEIQVDCDGGGTTATFDQQRMMQVFINLYSNALKFSPKGGIVKVAVCNTTLAERGTALYCVVSDQGIGIPDAELDTIFDKFTQSTKTNTGAGGSGLGLAICREIVHLHGGTIWAGKTMAGGAAIHFVLPKEPGKRCLEIPKDRYSNPRVQSEDLSINYSI